MNPFLAASVLVCAVFGLIQAKPADFYATRYDHIDVDTILNNRRMVNYYAACILNKGPCPPQGVEFKRILPEALETNCKRCTEKQKAIALRTIKRLRKEYPKIWDQLVAVWDPDDIYVKKFEATYGKKPTEAKPMIIANRFGEDLSAETNTISDDKDKTFPYPPAAEAGSSTNNNDKSVTNTLFTSMSTSSVTPSTTTTTTTTTTTRTTTKYIPIFTKKTVTIPVFNPSNSNLDATVSFGANVVGNLVKGFGSLTRKVAETGANLAGAVFTSIGNVVRPVIL